jgi:hypothetical protein
LRTKRPSEKVGEQFVLNPGDVRPAPPKTFLLRLRIDVS